MSIFLTPQQTLFLWYVIGKGGNWLDEIKPELESSKRKELERLDLITNEKRERQARGGARKRRSAPKSPSRALRKPRMSKASWIEVTEKGWAWANDNLDAPLPPKSQSGPILQTWLTHLHAFLRQQNLGVGDIFRAPARHSPAADVTTTTSLEDRIRNAYLDATGGAWNRRVRLSELRHRLSDIARDRFDATLLKMQQASKLVLFRLDNQREITDADRDAALLVGGEPRHLLHMGG